MGPRDGQSPALESPEFVANLPEIAAVLQSTAGLMQASGPPQLRAEVVGQIVQQGLVLRARC
eukprot:4107363-Pyramimonas_sp.AAC.1